MALRSPDVHNYFNLQRVMSYKVFFIVPLLLVIQIHSIHSQDGYATLGRGTRGGAGGSTVTVCTQDELVAAVTGDVPRIVRLVCNIALTTRVRVGSNKSLLGGSHDAGFTTSGLLLQHATNIIIRGLHFCCAIAPADGMTIDNTTNVWIDHNEFYSDTTHDKDYYDGLVDVVLGSDYITFSWNEFHDHYKTNLIGQSDDLGHIDGGKFHVTFHHNYWQNCNSRVPSVRFGTVHVYNNLYRNVTTSGINSRMGAQVLVERNIFRGVRRAVITNLDSRDDGFAVERNNDFGGSDVTITQQGTFYRPPYAYRLDPLNKLPFIIERRAGATIIF